MTEISQERADLICQAQVEKDINFQAQHVFAERDMINIMASPHYNRKMLDAQVSAVAAKYDIKESSLKRLVKAGEFKRRLKSTIEDCMQNAGGDALQVAWEQVVKAAEGGNLKACDMLFKIAGIYPDKKKKKVEAPDRGAYEKGLRALNGGE